MSNLESFDESKKKCHGCKKYFEESSIVGLNGQYLCTPCLKESRVAVQQFIDKNYFSKETSNLNQAMDEFLTFMEKYVEIQKNLIEDFKNEQT
jgi:hypothetical protein